LKVAHLTITFARGGRREAIASLARGTRALGVENHLCTLDALDADEKLLSDCFVATRELRRRGAFDRSAWRALADFVREHEIDIVHAHDAASQFAASVALPLRRPSLIMTFHRSSDVESKSARDRLRNALAALRCSAVVTASNERRRHFLACNRVPARKLVVIPFGTDVDRFAPSATARQLALAALGLAEDRRLIGVVGHFGSDKGVDIAIQAFLLAARDPALDQHVLCVLGEGDADQQRRIEALANDEFGDRIRFLGFRNDTERWFPAFDVLLHGARREAFGLVIIEAMACAVPVVATPVGGIPELVVDGSTGRLAAVATPEALARALRETLADEAARLRMAAAARRRATGEYSRMRCAERHLALYRSLVGPAARIVQSST
jgi:glycosyltransferase involved in cell wall biosynthesis